MRPILQSHLPDEQREVAAARLPAMRPVKGPWITIDDAYTVQIAERVRLMRETRAAVCAVEEGAEEAVRELYHVILAALPDLGFERNGDVVRCPDGREVTLDLNDPFGTLAQLIQEDQLQGYLDLKWEEVYAYEHTPHPVEYQLYYSV